MRENLMLKFKKIIQLIVYSILVLFAAQANAALELELTQGVDGALPIAVMPFTGEKTTEADALSKVIAADLQNSGRFKVAPTESLKQLPYSERQIDYSYWREQNIDNLVIGEVVPLRGKRVQVAFKLLDTIGGEHILLNKQFSLNTHNLRTLAHHISDLIYQKLTGDRGVFSTKIAYIVVKRKANKPTKYTLEVADADGHNPHVLLVSSEPIMSPAWSPDGKKIAYVSFEKKRAQVYVVDINNGKRKLITSYPGINGAPAWSPDGEKLALVLSKSGSPKIYIADLASLRLQQLTHGYTIDTEPAWSPDGNNILFTSDRGGAPQIYQIKLKNAKIQRLTFAGNYNARASYVPSSNNIVMLHRDTGFNIAVQDLKSGRLRVLTNSGKNESPSVSPNGKMVLYASTYKGNGVLNLISIDGRVRLRLPSRAGHVQEPAWSPFLG